MRAEAPPRVLAGMTGAARLLSRALVRSPEHARFAAWEGTERIVVNVATVERNLAGGPAEVSPPARARLLVQTVALGQRLAAG